MEEIKFSCTACHSALSALRSDVGSMMQCPLCRRTLKVPLYGIYSGMKLGDFCIEKCLGVGGMGEVWLATQELLNRKVAIKILSPDISQDEKFIQRFYQETRIAGRLSHPNIVVAFNAGEQGGIRFLVSAYIDGITSFDCINKDGALGECEVLRIGRDIAKALKYAWDEEHILHRDVKPENIMIRNDGTPMLMDMGISKILDEDVSLTMTGEFLGTPNYISPEQAQADPGMDSRSDQYSLGATLFHLLSGSLPYQATSAMGTLAQHLNDPVPDIQKVNSEVSAECSAIIQKTMAKSKEERYESWDDFIAAVDALLPPEMREFDTVKSFESSDEYRTSYRTIALLASLILIIVTAVFLSTTSLSQDDELMRISQSEPIPKIITPQVLSESDNNPELDRENTTIKKRFEAKEGRRLSAIMQKRWSDRLRKVKKKLIKEFNLSEENSEKLGAEILKLQKSILLREVINKDKKQEIPQNLLTMARSMLKPSQLRDFLAYLKKVIKQKQPLGKGRKKF